MLKMEDIMEENNEPQEMVTRPTSTRFRIRHGKLRLSFILYVICLICLGFLQIIGIVFFTKGFLLSRQVLPNQASCEDSVCFEPKFDKAVILIVDALRFDFVIPVENSTNHYHNRLPLLYDLNQEYPNNSLLLKFMADPPTTTLQRLKGLTTGSLPTFIDAGSNFDGDVINEDNWVSQLYNHGKKVAFVGDDTWDALFGPFFYDNLTYPYDSLNVWDLHSVDNGVIEHLFPLMESSSEWDVLIGHFLGVDHAGHRYGPSHFSMQEKLKQMNQVLSDVIDKLDDDTLLIVMGDHGMDNTGNHGGDSLSELEAALFMYSKKQFTKQKEVSHYNVDEVGRDYRSVDQIDLVPTLSILLGLPIPFNNLGFPIEEAFNDDSELALADYVTVKQIQKYRQLTNILKDDKEVALKYDDLMNFWESSSSDSLQFIEDSSLYQKFSLEKCKNLWARFDDRFISIGIILTAFSLMILIIYSRLIPPVVISQMSEEFITSILATVPLGLVGTASIYFIIRPENMPFWLCLLLGVAIGVVIGFMAPVMDRYSVPWLLYQMKDYFDFWSFFTLVITSLHCLSFASNSFTIWEDRLISFFLSTFGLLCVIFCLKIENKPLRVLGTVHSITFLILTRLSSTITLCREEQLPNCTSTFKLTWWSVVLLHLLTYVLPLCIKSFYNLTNSYHSAAPLWIGTGLKMSLFLNAVYWTLEFVENDDYLSSKINISFVVLKTIKLTLARIVFGIALFAANFGWSRGPLCIKLEMNDEASEGKKAIILGYGNAYGSTYFLLVVNFLAGIMLVTKPLGSISIFMMIFQLLSLLEIFQILDLRSNVVSPVIFCLLGYSHFFSTGHQATIPSIQWDVAFIITETITFPFTHITLILNTFGPFILACLSIPLITFWNIPPTTKPTTLLSRIIANCTTLLTYQTAVSLSSLIFATVFRRHLMVWKIFAPRFMLSGILLILLNVVIIFITIGFGTGRTIKQMNRIFGK